MFTTNQAFNNLALVDLIANIIKGGAGGGKVHLAQIPFTPNQNSAVTDFTEATFTGYAAVTLAAWSAPEKLAGAWRVVNSGVAHFEVGAAPVTPNTIGGYWIDDGGTPGHVVGYEVFATAVPMDSTGIALDIVPTWQQSLLQWSNGLP